MNRNLTSTHRRKNILTGEWILVSPHRNDRPWSGATEDGIEEVLPAYDKDCPLCPGNMRTNGEQNPNYTSTYMFVNDFGALTSDSSAPSNDKEKSSLFVSEPAVGECRVICFSPEHNKTLAELTDKEVLAVVKCWQDNFIELSEKYNCVHIFENKGAIMGCSQPHPHGQIWAHDHLSTEIEKKLFQFRQYTSSHKSCLLEDYTNEEIKDGTRVVLKNNDWLVVVPFWASWPFETLLICRHRVAHFGQLDEGLKSSLAIIIRQLTVKYDNIFNCSFPYSMGWHNAPNQLEGDDVWQLHAHFYPPLLRSATIKKFMVGYEMLAESQRDLTAEKAAEILRSCSEVHYKQQKT